MKEKKELEESFAKEKKKLEDNNMKEKQEIIIEKKPRLNLFYILKYAKIRN